MGRRTLRVLFLILLPYCTLSLAQEHPEPTQVFAWGHNNVGQLGLVDYQDQFEPTLVSALEAKHFTQLALGGSAQVAGHTLALTASGRIFSTGDNSFGQLGFGDNKDRDMLVPIPSLFTEEFVSVGAGEAHSVGLSSEGRVYVWGSNTAGQLGLGAGATKMARRPTELPVWGSEEPGKGERVVGIAAGGRHALAWTSAGRLISWGDNAHGQLGAGDKEPHDSPVFVSVPLGKTDTIVKAAAGAAHSLVLTKAGVVYGWGKNAAGQLGLGDTATNKDVTAPTKLPALSPKRIVSLAAGAAFSVVLDQAGALYAFGDNTEGQLGVAGSAGAGAAELRPVGTGKPVADVVCGHAHVIAVLEDGTLIGWGANTAGQLGIGNFEKQATPRPLLRLGGSHKAAAVAAGASSTMAVTTDGVLYGWGKNNAGQLGKRASKLFKHTPDLIASSRDSMTFKQVAAGGFSFHYEGHSLALTEGGEMHSWGWNAFGQLGLGDMESGHNIPHKIAWLGKSPVKQIAAGQFVSAAVTEGGEVLAWGLNEAGQLGRGDMSAGTMDTPVRVPFPGVEIASVAVGYSHLLALSTRGKVFSWGRNFHGQLGHGDHKDRDRPQQVMALADEAVVAVAAGQYHSLAVTARGQVFAWGYNHDYELGLGDDMDRVLPQGVPFPGSSQRISAVAAGGYHSLALSADGVVFSWGMNVHGQLGRGHRDKMPGKLPNVVPFTGAELNAKPGERLRVTAIAAGTWHSLAALEVGGAAGWGRCQHGQVGVKCTIGEGIATPQRIVGLGTRTVLAVAAGAAHSLAIVAGQDRGVATS